MVGPPNQSDADLWEELVKNGLSEPEATRHVELRRLGGIAEPTPPPDDTMSRLTGGVKGAAEGVGDLITGAGSFAKRVMTAPVSDFPGIAKDAALAIPRAVGNIRDVTQSFRSGEASSEDLARAWTGGSATVLAPGVRGVGVPENMAGKIGQGLLSLEKTVAPGRAYARMRLTQAAAKGAEATPESDIPELPDPGGWWNKAYPTGGKGPAPVDPSAPAVEFGSGGSSRVPMDRTIPKYDEVIKSAPRAGPVPTAAPTVPEPQPSVSGVNQVLQQPAYQQAGILAKRILADPQLQQKYPQFVGMDEDQATAELQRMMVTNGTVPPITSIDGFLKGLAKPQQSLAGKGKVFPFYPRGGAAEQAVSPSPVRSAPQGPTMTVDQVRTTLQLARTLGQSNEQILARIRSQGVPDNIIQQALAP